MKKKLKDKQRAKLKAKRKAMREEESKNVRFKCMSCGVEEDIPRDVVDMMDIQDGGDLRYPPRFSCESCDGQMEPILYRSTHGITYRMDDTAE